MHHALPKIYYEDLAAEWYALAADAHLARMAERARRHPMVIRAARWLAAWWNVRAEWALDQVYGDPWALRLAETEYDCVEAAHRIIDAIARECDEPDEFIDRLAAL